MITFINEELFTKIVEKRDGKDGRPDFYRTIIQSSSDVITKRNGKILTAPKTIEHVLHVEKDNFNVENTDLHVKWVDNRPLIRLNQKPENQTDLSVFLIAIPYNGFMVPVQKSRAYRVYKGIDTTLETPIEFEGKSFKHIAYITLVPNGKLLASIEDGSEDGPTTFEFVSYSTRKENDVQVTTKTTFSLDFSLVNGEIWVEKTVNAEECDPVNREELRRGPLFPLLVNPKKRRNPAKNTNESDRPVYNPKLYPKATEYIIDNTPPDNSLSDMIRDAKLNDTDTRPNRNSGKKKKKRRR